MENSDENKFYREKIVELVEKIGNPQFLKFVYEMLQSFKKKWGI